MAALAVILALFLSAPAFAQNVSIKATDGFALKSAFKKPAAGKRTLVMLHGWQSSKEEWTPLMKALETDGWGTLAYDSRTQGPRNRFVDDIGAVLRYLEKEGVPRDRVSLAGASLGANLILKYAEVTGFSGALVCLSPGLDFQGVKADVSIVKTKAPVLLVASTKDEYSFVSSMRLATLNRKAVFWNDVKPGHGVQMFDEALLKRLVEWLNRN